MDSNRFAKIETSMQKICFDFAQIHRSHNTYESFLLLLQIRDKYRNIFARFMFPLRAHKCIKFQINIRNRPEIRSFDMF